MADIILKVDPQLVTAKASEMQACRNSLSNIMEDVKQNITSLKVGFDSESGQVFQTKFNACYDDITNMLAIVDSYVKSLNDVANIMTTAEKASKAAADALPTDGVFSK